MATEAKRIQLYPAQKAFLDSKALFRAFVGGVGSGKSWAGAYDMVRRAKPGRLYMVVAPTYPMLADASMRSFEAVACNLGACLPEDVKRSPPPSVTLRTGAEVLFRSADDPDRLRGPNLSGVWMDEASLVVPDAYSILIGRLREAGEQGWLSATFTPKGRLHWTYEAFASGRVNTALFHARTADNPFLPSSFHETVAGQYTSALAAQELEGQFVDAGGQMFARSWFGLVEPAQVPELVVRVRAWDLAATPLDEKKARDPDWTAGVLMGRDRGGTLYVLDVQRDRLSAQGVQALVRRTAERDGRHAVIVMEQEPGSSGKTVIDHYSRNVLQGYNFRGEKSTGSKADRAAPFAAQAEAGAVKLVRAAWNRAFLDEAEMFPFAPHDDQIDAASCACWHAAQHAAGMGWRSPKQVAAAVRERGKEPVALRRDPRIAARRFGLGS